MKGKSPQTLEAYYKKQNFRNPRDRRLVKEHLSIAQLADQTDRISYEPVGDRLPPEGYLIGYHVRSIVGIDEQQQPVYGNYHEVEVTFPSDYPISSAKIYMKSPAWHPNIKSEGRFKGRICGNTSEFGKAFNLNMLVIRVGEILQYKNYHAEPIAPFPEDESVARWVRDVAEPNDIVNKSKDIVVDSSSLLSSRSEADLPEDSGAQLVAPPISKPPVVEPTPEPPAKEPEKPAEETGRRTIKIRTSRNQAETPTRRTIKIKPKDQD